MIQCRQISMNEFSEIKELYREVFTAPPWEDDWSDDKQLTLYIEEIMCGKHPLHFGLYVDGKLEGIALGMIKHWCQGTEYYLDEFCIRTNLQGKGLGTKFLHMIFDEIQSIGLCGIFLATDHDKPAFEFYRKFGFELQEKHVSFWKDV